MQILKEEVREEIVNAAIDVFLEKGFERASMHNIAEKAQVCVSNIYNYFEAKNNLFYTIVDPVYYRINLLLQEFTEYDNGQSFSDNNFTERFIQIIAKTTSIFIKEHHRRLLLIFDKSQGTKYEQSKEELIKLLESHFISGLNNSQLNESTSFIMHIGATNLVEGLLEIIRHYRSDAWVEQAVNDFIKYHLQGFAQFFT